MKRTVNHRLLVAALVAGWMLILTAPTVEANQGGSNPEGWIDKLTGFVLIQKGIEAQGDFDPYLEQLAVLRNVLRVEWKQGDLGGTYVAINRFMNMLEAREGGIPARAAKWIWDFCYQVTPIALHDVERHRRGFGIEHPEKLM